MVFVFGLFRFERESTILLSVDSPWTLMEILSFFESGNFYEAQILMGLS
jgi:hypothetical protein